MKNPKFPWFSLAEGSSETSWATLPKSSPFKSLFLIASTLFYAVNVSCGEAFSSAKIKIWEALISFLDRS